MLMLCWRCGCVGAVDVAAASGGVGVVSVGAGVIAWVRTSRLQ